MLVLHFGFVSPSGVLPKSLIGEMEGKECEREEN